MLPRLSSLVRAVALAMAALIVDLSTAPSARAQPTVEAADPANYNRAASLNPAASLSASDQPRDNALGQWAGFSEVVCPGGCYGGGFHLFGCRAYAGAGYYGFFRRYWGYGYYGPNFNMGPGGSPWSRGKLYVATRRGHGLNKHGDMSCSAAGCAGPDGAASAGGMNPSATPADGQSNSPAKKPSPPTPNTAHLQLLVPENAEVLIEGNKTTATGTIRDFVSPSLNPEKKLIYRIVVRYPDAGGKTVEESHVIRVRANDQLRIDCTKPASVEQTTASVKRP